MTTVAIYVALIGYVLYKRLTPHAVGTPKKLFMLPIILTAIGFSDVSHAHLNDIDVAVTVVAAVVSLVGGAVRGAFDRFVTENGHLSVRWGAASVVALVATLATRAVIDVIGVAAGGTSAGSGTSLVLALGLTLLAEAVVIHLRALSGSVPVASAGASRRRGR